jgi:hypothetical protein
LAAEEIRKPRVVVQAALYVALFVTAVLLRFIGLGSTGLSDREAVSALQAFDLARGTAGLIGSQPGYISLTTGLFSLFGSTDFLARFWSAVFGSFLVLVPWLYRKYLGKVGALVLALLLAIDPLMVSLSRTAASSMMGITCLLAGLGLLLMRRPVLASLCWGLFFTAGSEIWPGVVALLLSVFAFRYLFASGAQAESDWKKLTIPGLVLFVLVTTQLLLHPNGFSGFGSSLAEYIRSWGAMGEVDLGHFFLEIVLLQLPLVIFGLIAVVSGIVKGNKFFWFLSTWWGLAFILVLVNPSRSPALMGWATIPALCLTALLLSNYLSRIRFDNRWIGFGQAAFSFLMLAVAFLYLMNVINFPDLDPLKFRNQLLAALLPVILLVAVTGLFSWGWNSSAAKQGLLLTLCTVGVFTLLSSGWKATGWTSPAEMQLWQGRTVVGDKVLMEEVSNLGQWTHGRSDVLTIEIAGVESPSLDWALRNVSSVQHTAQVNPKTTAETFITPSDPLIAAEASYRGQQVIWSKTPDVQAFSATDWVKWLVYRRAPVQSEVIVLWERNDLFK